MGRPKRRSYTTESPAGRPRRRATIGGERGARGREEYALPRYLEVLSRATHWRRWQAEHRAGMVDLTLDRRDPRPVVFDVLRRLCHWGQHPWLTVRRMLLNAD